MQPRTVESKVFIFSEQTHMGQYLQSNQCMKVSCYLCTVFALPVKGREVECGCGHLTPHDVGNILRMRRHLNC